MHTGAVLSLVKVLRASCATVSTVTAERLESDYMYSTALLKRVVLYLHQWCILLKKVSSISNCC